MDGDFKDRLKDYMEGKLSEEEKRDMDRELDKLEAYQSFIDAQSSKEFKKEDILRNEKRIIARSKWKARFISALIALGIILAFVMLSGLATNIYYVSGKTPRKDIYCDVVKSAVAITEPNIGVGASGITVGALFSMDMKGELKKRIGGRDVRAGSMDVAFLFGQAGYPQREWFLDDNTRYGFLYPSSAEQGPGSSDWNKLERLPDGTVCEAYISLDKLYGTNDVLKLVSGSIKPVWFAVDTGFDDPLASKAAVYPIGFPYEPLWHSGDWTVTSRTEQNRGLSGKVVTEVKQSPGLDPYGSGDVRDKNFLDTLKLLKEYEGIAERISYGPSLNLGKRIEYIEKQGVRIYGIVVTGPTKDILKLKSEAWVTAMSLGEVRLWNLD